MPTGVPRRRTKNLAEREIAEWNRQRTETQRQLAEKYRLENQIKRGEYLNRAVLEKAFAQLADAARAGRQELRAGQKVERGFSTEPGQLAAPSAGGRRRPKPAGERLKIRNPKRTRAKARDIILSSGCNPPLLHLKVYVFTCWPPPF